MVREEWTSHLEMISNEINGKLKIIHGPSLGMRFEYYNAQISLAHDGNDIIIEQLFTQKDYENFDVGNIHFTYKFENRFDFYLYLNEREFLERLFNRKRVETGNSTFDSKFTIKSNDEKLVKEIFRNLNLQEQIISNRFLIINISSENQLTTIKMKDLREKKYNKSEYLCMLKNFNFIIESIKK